MMKKCPKCEGHNIMSVEYSYGNKYRYDGVSEYECLGCGYRQGRWCGTELKQHECEPVFCTSTKHPYVIDIIDEQETVPGDGDKQ